MKYLCILLVLLCYWGGFYLMCLEPLAFWVRIPELTGAQVLQIYSRVVIVGMLLMSTGITLQKIMGGR